MIPFVSDNTQAAGNPLARALGKSSALALLTVALSGCHSAFVQATVFNRSATPVKLLEVDYPTASFGTGQLAPGATFRYRFKILGDGPAKVLWTDQANHEHTVPGPDLREGQEGTLTITLTDKGAEWGDNLSRPH